MCGSRSVDSQKLLKSWKLPIMAMIIAFLLSVNPQNGISMELSSSFSFFTLKLLCGPDATKPVFGISDKARLKPETS